MEILRYPLGQLQANCYVLIRDKKCIVIDPADEAAFILEELQRRNLSLVGMIATHGHFDHVMAAGELQMAYKPKIVPFYINKKDTFLIQRLGETAKYFLGYEPQVIPPQKLSSLTPGAFKLSSFSCEITDTPGHTPGSVSLYFRKENIVFTGDTLFSENIGRYDFSYSSKADLKKSVESLLKLPEETVVYSGHGEETTIGDELKNLNLYF